MAAIPTRPVPLPVNFDGIPGELRYLNQWVLWRYVWKDDAEDRYNATYRYKEALACETKATELNQTFVLALNHKGDLLAYLGEYQAAMDNYNRTLIGL